MKDQYGNEIAVVSHSEETVATGLPPVQAPRPTVSIRSKLAAWAHIFWVRKWLSIPVISVALLALIAAIPLTRYPLFGLFLKQNYAVKVVDSQSGRPVSNASVSLGSNSGTTDANGEVIIKLKVGRANLKVDKKYYESAQQSVTVPLFGKEGVFRQVNLVATGRQTIVGAYNSINKTPVANVKVAFPDLDTEVTTGEDGEAIAVLPVAADAQTAIFSADGYVQRTTVIKSVEGKDAANVQPLTPAGKVYFLSKLSGKIDVVKTDLDGTNRQTVLAGTGKEDEGQTVLLASRDWHYLALYSKRDGGDNPKLFLINTQKNDELTVMDEGDADFTLYGWADSHFVYQVARHSVKIWEAKRLAIKAYDASNNKIVLLDETLASGEQSNYINENYEWVTLVGSDVMFFKAWTSQSTYYKYSHPEVAIKQSRLTVIKPDGSNRKELLALDLPSQTSIYTTYYKPFGSYQHVVYEPGEVFFVLAPYEGETRYYKTTASKAAEDSEARDFIENGRAYPTYLISPDGNQTFWSETRDGRNILFVGGADGQNGSEIGSLSEYKPYGWFTQDYVLVTKNASELYIMPVSGGEPIKISDYHKPQYNYYGYGGGYGGI